MYARRRRRYLALMTTCLVLFVSAWAFVRFLSVPAAVGLCVAALAIPPVAVILGNRREPDDRWFDEEPRPDEDRRFDGGQRPDEDRRTDGGQRPDEDRRTERDRPIDRVREQGPRSRR